MIETLSAVEILLEYGEKAKHMCLGENLVKKDMENIGLEMRIEDLQNTKEKEISDVAERIINTYWSSV